MEKTISVNGADYEIVELLGRGKGGYSYLASSCDRLAVLKQIHHEPCDFYTFGNKLESEKNAYSRLKEVGIRIGQWGNRTEGVKNAVIAVVLSQKPQNPCAARVLAMTVKI